MGLSWVWCFDLRYCVMGSELCSMFRVRVWGAYVGLILFMKMKANCTKCFA